MNRTTEADLEEAIKARALEAYLVRDRLTND